MKCWLTAGLVLSVAVALAGCREDEQNRPWQFQPGVYKGDKTPTLTDEQRRELQERANRQR